MNSHAAAPAANKPTLSFWQIWNMSFGFLGIQFGWGLQLGNMSAIYEYLGAQPHELPILWLAAPMTGLLIQPIVGYYSDRTWNKIGRRKPYFLMGAILASIALIFMPHSTTIWMAAGLLWILDASINISMEPFRAFVADMLPKEQVTRGFTMQSFFIGLGAVLAAVLPWFFTDIMGMAKTSVDGVPAFLKISFAIGGISFLLAVLWTVFRTKEYPPADMDAFREMKAEGGGFLNVMKEIFSNIFGMPKVMKQLAVVQFFTWLGMFLMWFYLTVTIANDIMGAPNPQSELYAEGVAWGNICMGFYSAITFLFAFFIPKLAQRMGKKYLHAICLLIGGLGLIFVSMAPNKYWILLSMTGVGIAWTSILAMPYSILAPKLPAEKMGIYMGIFNFFIVIPEIMATLFFGWVMENWLDNDRMMAIIIGGVMLCIAAGLSLLVDDKEE